MDPWLSPFSDIGMRLLLALVDDGGVGDGMENGFHLLELEPRCWPRALKVPPSLVLQRRL